MQQNTFIVRFAIFSEAYNNVVEINEYFHYIPGPLPKGSIGFPACAEQREILQGQGRIWPSQETDIGSHWGVKGRAGVGMEAMKVQSRLPIAS